MGYPHDGLIPPAILLDNPGITRTEFVELLNKTNSTPFDVKKHARWDCYGRIEIPCYHKGLHGLAEILKLAYRDEFTRLGKEEVTPNGIIYPPFLLIEPRRTEGEWISPKYKVTNLTSHVPSDSIEKMEDYVYADDGNEPKVGGTYWDDIWMEETGIIEEVLEKEDLMPRESDTDAPRFMYKLKVRMFRRIETEEEFESLEELVAKYPRFDPDFMFDFSRERGALSTDLLNHDSYRWVQRSGRYYLDDEYTLSHIPASAFAPTEKCLFGYMDMVLTAEAIKHRAWKLLSRCGLKHLDSFLRRFPDSRARYERAVWDSHTSLAARERGMSYTDFLRWRMGDNLR